jgi:hypothetical protein
MTIRLLALATLAAAIVCPQEGNARGFPFPVPVPQAINVHQRTPQMPPPVTSGDGCGGFGKVVVGFIETAARKYAQTPTGLDANATYLAIMKDASYMVYRDRTSSQVVGRLANQLHRRPTGTEVIRQDKIDFFLPNGTDAGNLNNMIDTFQNLNSVTFHQCFPQYSQHMDSMIAAERAKMEHAAAEAEVRRAEAAARKAEAEAHAAQIKAEADARAAQLREIAEVKAAAAATETERLKAEETERQGALAAAAAEQRRVANLPITRATNVYKFYYLVKLCNESRKAYSIKWISDYELSLADKAIDAAIRDLKAEDESLDTDEAWTNADRAARNATIDLHPCQGYLQTLLKQVSPADIYNIRNPHEGR